MEWEVSIAEVSTKMARSVRMFLDGVFSNEADVVVQICGGGVVQRLRCPTSNSFTTFPSGSTGLAALIDDGGGSRIPGQYHHAHIIGAGGSALLRSVGTHESTPSLRAPPKHTKCQAAMRFQQVASADVV